MIQLRALRNEWENKNSRLSVLFLIAFSLTYWYISYLRHSQFCIPLVHQVKPKEAIVWISCG